MKKYLQVINNTWEEITAYRLNFLMWRIRNLIQLLTIYFLWQAILPQKTVFFGYSSSLMLTYILASSIITAIVFSSRTQEIGENISNGDLSIFLIRPLNYFGYWFARDMGDKLMNIFFSIFELLFLFLLLKPPFIIQTNLMILLLTGGALIVAVFLFFLIGCLLGLIGFWNPDIWSPRFIFMIIVGFFAGGLFPLDVLPSNLFYFFQKLPFPYLLFFPLEIYLNKISAFEIMKGFFISLFWILSLFFLVKFVWNKGLRVYSAEGR